MYRTPRFRRTFRIPIVALAISVVPVPAAAQLPECPSDRSSGTITKDELPTILEKHAKWLEKEINPDGRFALSAAFEIRKAIHEGRVEGRAVLCNKDLTQINLDGVELSGADMRGADLTDASLKGTHLFHTYLDEACLARAAMVKADLSWAGLDKAKMFGTDLRSATLSFSSLNHTAIEGANVAMAKFDNVFFDNTFYSPESEPPMPYVGSLQGLATVTYFIPNGLVFPYVYPYCDGRASLSGKPLGLIQFRKMLIESGDRSLEREATFAIEHARTEELLENLRFDFGGVNFKSRFKTWVSTLHWVLFGNRSWLSGAEGLLRLVLFEWTSGYGLSPARPLLILLMLILCFAIVYWFPISLVSTSRSAGIYRLWPKDRVGITRNGLGFLEPKVERVSARPLKGLLYALQFSALSALQIGWREFNFGAWVARIQSNEYALGAKGWVRSLSGCQAVLSVYLLALSILTYFGRPF